MRQLRASRCRQHHRQHGQFLIILVVSIMLAAGIFALGLREYHIYQRRQTVTAAEQQISNLVQHLAVVYNGAPGGYVGISDSVLATQGLVRSSAVQGGEVITPFNTRLTVAAATLYAANDSVSITIAGIPKADCPDFIAGVESLAYDVTVNGTYVKNIPGNTPFTPRTTNPACANGSAMATSTLWIHP
ncbi:MAG TPA: type 4 pilus major pilin [Nevskiaceae bacterium]|nr:type 4 pilus major pilin [Nevskiaceae bacterium]